MSNPKHTPGPWHTWQATTNKRLKLNKWGVSNADSNPIADCGNRLNSESNARLIAAAPELLEALQAAIAIHRVQAETCRIEARSGVHPDHNLKYAAELDLHADHWEALVAKAQGGVK